MFSHMDCAERGLRTMDTAYYAPLWCQIWHNKQSGISTGELKIPQSLDIAIGLHKLHAHFEKIRDANEI